VSVKKPVRLWGFEVLLRLAGEDEEPVAAATLVPTAERFGLMPDIDRWVVCRLFETLAVYRDEITRLGVRFAVNLAAQSVSDGEFLSFLCKQIAAAGIAGESLCFEIPETAAVSNLARARLFMERVGEHGCTFALDDFGAGASSFNYLPSLPLSFLKIDPELIAKIEKDPFAAAMVSAIREVSRSLGLETVAESVEDGDTRARLLELGVDRVQGYHVCHPLPLREVLGKLAVQPNLLAS
jgi:EAL domain-containing protein (putative c-di-GMP-specific phosphodiesterase class I)